MSVGVIFNSEFSFSEWRGDHEENKLHCYVFRDIFVSKSITSCYFFKRIDWTRNSLLLDIFIHINISSLNLISYIDFIFSDCDVWETAHCSPSEFRSFFHCRLASTSWHTRLLCRSGENCFQCLFKHHSSQTLVLYKIKSILG